MVRSGRRHNSRPSGSVVRNMRRRMSSPDRSRNGSAGCSTAGAMPRVAGAHIGRHERLRPRVRIGRCCRSTYLSPVAGGSPAINNPAIARTVAAPLARQPSLFDEDRRRPLTPGIMGRPAPGRGRYYRKQSIILNVAAGSRRGGDGCGQAHDCASRDVRSLDRDRAGRRPARTRHGHAARRVRR